MAIQKPDSVRIDALEKEVSELKDTLEDTRRKLIEFMQDTYSRER